MGNKIPLWKAAPANTDLLKSSIFEYTAKTLDGQTVSLSKYKSNKALLVINVASQCGLAKKQYTGLVNLRNQLLTKGSFEILAFPCSQFLNQERGSPEDIKQFAQRFNATFPFFQKTNVNGDNAHPIFTYLKWNTPSFRDIQKNTTFLKPIPWNFSKFLLDGEGHVVEYYSPMTDPLDILQDAEQVMEELKKGSFYAVSPSHVIKQTDLSPSNIKKNQELHSSACSL